MSPSSFPAPPDRFDPAIEAAIEKFKADCQLDQFGTDRPEASLSFIGGDHVVIRNSWSEVIGRIPLTQVLTQPLN